VPILGGLVGICGFLCSALRKSGKTANQNIVEQELEIVFRRLAVAEKMLEDRELADEHEKQIRSLIIDEDIDDRTASVFIDLVAAIVTQCE